ncbi:MAG: AhpC/TSA family protein [Chitinophagaceae bacterium]|nr:MAG: AhpC/TSA family protein [Chitinophagaceae bacterium]
MLRRSLFFVLIGVAISGAAQTEKPFSVKGRFTNISLPVQKVFLSYRAGDKNITDSVVPAEGVYTFSGKLAEPTAASLRVRYAPDAEGKPVKFAGTRDFISLFLSADKIDVISVDSFSNVKVTGSKANDDYAKLTEALKPFNTRMRALSAEYSKAAAAKDETARKAAEDKMDALDKESKLVYRDFVTNHLQSPVAVYAISQFAGWDIQVDEVEPLFNQLPATARNAPAAKLLSEQIAIAKKTSVGREAMDFTQNDTLGIPVKLSSFRGKYLLVDFWASWCGPCRRENPNIVKAYQAYREKGFHILGVSLDRPADKDKWLKAIHDDNLTWTHVSDLKFWQNEVAQQYGIQAIPQNLLLDPQGKIIAKNLNGEQLQQKLGEILKP